jgi:hypothetical protein
MPSRTSTNPALDRQVVRARARLLPGVPKALRARSAWLRSSSRRNATNSEVKNGCMPPSAGDPAKIVLVFDHEASIHL